MYNSQIRYNIIGIMLHLVYGRVKKMLKEKLLKLNHIWKQEYTYSIIMSFVAGLIVHMYKFTNNLPNHDSMYNFYSDQNVLGSGRWFLSIACGFSSYYDLPWVNGIISILFIALTVIVIINLFNINNKWLILLINGIIIVHPATTEILCFEFTADGYMMAMLLAALSVKVIIKGIESKKKIIAVILSSVLLCLSCGIYQAYISFALVLFICYFIWILLKSSYTNKHYMNHIICMMVSLVFSLALYYIIWKICMQFQGVQANDYQGISQVGLNINNIISAPKDIVITFIGLFLEKNIFKHGISLYAVFNLLFFIISGVVLIVSVIKSKAHKSLFKILGIIICLIAIPFAVCIWRFTSPSVNYALRMLHSVVIIYVFSLILCFEYLNSNIFKGVYYLLFVAIIFNLFVQANIAYYYLNYEYEKTYSEAIDLNYSLNNALREYGKDHKIAIVGHREKEAALDQSGEANGSFMYTNMIEKSLLTDTTHTQNFLRNVLYFDGEFADYQTITKIEATNQYADMVPFFDNGEIELIDDVIVVKLG